eukprot:scaffold25928_cov50-Phaeocystis_antarctica.AAC.1
MVELGERMLLVPILGTVTVLGAFISITAAYHIKLGSVSKQLAVRTMPLPEPAARARLQALPVRNCGAPALHTAHARHPPPTPFGTLLLIRE